VRYATIKQAREVKEVVFVGMLVVMKNHSLEYKETPKYITITPLVVEVVSVQVQRLRFYLPKYMPMKLKIVEEAFVFQHT